ncbi:MAG: hypothetical protein ABSE86_20390 [Bryobacteraceae bacterium]
MKNFIIVLAVSALACTAAFAGEMTGYISDEKCAVSGAKAKTAAEWIDPAQFEGCAKRCVKAGSAAVFVTEDNKILKVDAASVEKVAPHIGHKVTVTGKVEGGVLKIDSISSAKM